MPGTGCGGKTRWPGTCANVRPVISADTIAATKKVRISSPLSRPERRCRRNVRTKFSIIFVWLLGVFLGLFLGLVSGPVFWAFRSQVSWRFREGTGPGYAARQQKTTRSGPFIAGIFCRNVAWWPFRHKRDCPKPRRGPYGVSNQGKRNSCAELSTRPHRGTARPRKAPITCLVPEAAGFRKLLYAVGYDRGDPHDLLT